MEKYPAARRAVVSALTDARKAARLSQRQLSSKLGAVHNYCQQVEALEQGIDAEEVIPWARACGTTASAVFGVAEHLLRIQQSEVDSRALVAAKTARGLARARKEKKTARVSRKK